MLHPSHSTTIETFNPTRPSERVAAVAVPSPAEVDAQVAAAIDAQPAWSASASDRSAALHRLADAVLSRADAFAELMVREVGKPIMEARGEVDRAVSILRYYAQVPLDPIGEEFPAPQGAAQLSVRRVPLGVVLAICPWNFPLAIPLWKAAPALAFGNAVLLKPASQSVGVAELLAESAGEALPPGVLSVLPLPADRMPQLLDDARIAGVTFTGSTRVGLEIASAMARRSAPAQAEMGGHSPAIVLEDADLAQAAKLIVGGAMSYAGQKCTATRRVIAVGDVGPSLAEALAAEIETLVVGDPAGEDVVAGPLIDARARDGFQTALADAQREGGRILAQATEVPGDGYFVVPTIVALDDPSARANQEETFGPLLTMISVADEEAAIRVANGTRYGLSGAVHSTDVARAIQLAKRLHCGMQRVNAATSGVDYYAPFGGEAFSSFGPREQGRAARDFFTSTRTLSVGSTG